MHDLTSLGRRICILGPSNSGKSTLAVALGQKLGAPAIHLDLLQHLPNTDWVQRSAEEFARLHDEAINGEAWVMDGNYSRLMPQRLARATGIIRIQTGTSGNLWRYVRRTLFERGRIGALDGGQDSIKWDMIRHIVVVQPRSRGKSDPMIAASGLPVVHIPGMRTLNRYYAYWGLTRPSKSGPGHPEPLRQ